METLLKSGVDPNLKVSNYRQPFRGFRRRGIIQLEWRTSLRYATGMQNAAIKHDIRFGEILLDAGANVNSIDDYLLEIAAYMSRTADKDSDVLDFVRLLI